MEDEGEIIMGIKEDPAIASEDISRVEMDIECFENAEKCKKRKIGMFSHCLSFKHMS